MPLPNAEPLPPPPWPWPAVTVPPNSLPVAKLRLPPCWTKIAPPAPRPPPPPPPKSPALPPPKPPVPAVPSPCASRRRRRSRHCRHCRLHLRRRRRHHRRHRRSRRCRRCQQRSHHSRRHCRRRSRHRRRNRRSRRCHHVSAAVAAHSTPDAATAGAAEDEAIRAYHDEADAAAAAAIRATSAAAIAAGTTGGSAQNNPRVPRASLPPDAARPTPPPPKSAKTLLPPRPPPPVNVSSPDPASPVALSSENVTPLSVIARPRPRTAHHPGRHRRRCRCRPGRRIVDREIADRDVARIVEEAAMGSAAVQRIAGAVDAERIAAGEVDRIKIGRERKAVGEGDRAGRVRRRSRSRQVDLRQGSIQLSFAGDGEARGHSIPQVGAFVAAGALMKPRSIRSARSHPSVNVPAKEPRRWRAPATRADYRWLGACTSLGNLRVPARTCERRQSLSGGHALERDRKPFCGRWTAPASRGTRRI